MSFSFSAQIGRVIVGRQRFFQPGDAVFGHGAGQFLDGFEAVAAVAHAPPGVGVHHQVEIGADGLAHAGDRFHVPVGAEGGTHFVGAETEAGDGGGFGGVGLRGHVHAGAAVETDAVAHAAAQQLGNRHAARLAHQIVERDFGRAVHLGEGGVRAGTFQELDAQGVGIGQGAALEERADGALDGLLRPARCRGRGHNPPGRYRLPRG